MSDGEQLGALVFAALAEAATGKRVPADSTRAQGPPDMPGLPDREAEATVPLASSLGKSVHSGVPRDPAVVTGGFPGTVPTGMPATPAGGTAPVIPEVPTTPPKVDTGSTSLQPRSPSVPLFGEGPGIPPWLGDAPATGPAAQTPLASEGPPGETHAPRSSAGAAGITPAHVETGTKIGARRDPSAIADPMPSGRDSAASTAFGVSTGQDVGQLSPELTSFRLSDDFPYDDLAGNPPRRTTEASAADLHPAPPWLPPAPGFGPADTARRSSTPVEGGTRAASQRGGGSRGSTLPVHEPFGSGTGHSLQGVRGDFPALQQEVNGHRLVWLDNGATTQKPQAVIDSVSKFYERDNSNVHRGAHTLAARATDAYEGARQKVQRFLGAARPEEVVFVRGTTEAINLVAQAWGRQNLEAGDEILLTRLEHHANIVPWQLVAQETGALIRVIPADTLGDVRLDAYEAMLSPKVKLVGITQIANAIGTVLPVGPMTAMAKQHGARVLIDGAQSIAHLPVDVSCLGADFFAFSGHKIYGPTGIGVLWARLEVLESMPPWQGGGSMIRDVTFERTVYSDPPAKFEAGTPNLAGAVGLGTAVDYVEARGRPQIAAYEHALLEQMVDGLATVPGLSIVGDPMLRAAAVSFVVEGREPQEIAEHLDRAGIAVRAGHHCAQPALRHFGLEETVRASLGIYNEPSDIEYLVDTLRRLGTRPGAGRPAPAAHEVDPYRDLVMPRVDPARPYLDVAIPRGDAPRSPNPRHGGANR